MAAIILRSLLTGRATVAQQLYLRASVLNVSSETSNALVKRNETLPEERRKSPEQIEALNAISELPKSQVNRLARIYMPARNAMQSGSNNTHQWRLCFDNQERWENPLIGWTSSADPLSNTTLSFRTSEEAIEFAVRNGFTYQVSKPNKLVMQNKAYGDSFSWNKRTRIGSK